MKEEKIKEIVYMAVQATKKENSSLIGELKSQQAIMVEHISDLKTGVDKLDEKITFTNGKIAAVNKWKEQVVGGAKVALVVVLPILTWALVKLVNL